MSFPRYFDETVALVKIVQKSKSWFMRFLSGCLQLLNKMKVTAIDDFMNNYVTTIGHTIYGGEGWSMDMEVSSTLMHELTHITERELDPWYDLKYLLSPKCRAFYELTCVQTEMLFKPERQTAEYVEQRAQFFAAYGIPLDISLREGLARLDELKIGRPQPAASMVFDAYKAWKI